MSLKILREEIDIIDQGLLRLLNKRLEIAEQIGKVKADQGMPVFDEARQELLLSALENKNEGKLSSKALRAIFQEIIAASLEVQK